MTTNNPSTTHDNQNNSATMPDTQQAKQSHTAGFIEQLQTLANDMTRKIPPLEKWHPKLSGKMNVTVKANGEWWHEGKKVTRQSLVDLFAKVLWAETDDDGTVSYYLKSPVEKWQIEVDDAPLLISEVNSIEDGGKTYLQFTTSNGDIVCADEQHPLSLGLPLTHSNLSVSKKQASQPYLLVRQNGDSALYGLLHRNVFYHLLSLGELKEDENSTTLTLKSGNATFNLTMNNEA